MSFSWRNIRCGEGMEKRASYRVAQGPCPIVSRAVMSGIRAKRGEAELDSVVAEIAELDWSKETRERSK
jgi:hypothetical protein